ncbi:MAG: glycosyltransferase family 2 protein [Acidimicrobiales bacterium]
MCSSVDVVLPALDEAAALPGVLAAFPAGYRPIVVDNGSTDGTAEVAARCGAHVVVEPQRGFGAACWRGLHEATSDYVCFMDADGSFDPTELPGLVAAVSAGTADLMLGARRAQPGSWPLHARVGNGVLAFELRRRSGIPLHDLGPMRAIRRADLLGLGMRDRRSGWPLEMVLRAHRRGLRIAERPVTYRPRIGRSKVTGTVRGTVRAVVDMSRILASVDAGTGSAPVTR